MTSAHSSRVQSGLSAELRACRIYSARTLRFFLHHHLGRPTVHDGFIAGAFHKLLASHSSVTKLYCGCKTINKSIVYSSRGFGVLLGPHVKRLVTLRQCGCKPMMVY